MNALFVESTHRLLDIVSYYAEIDQGFYDSNPAFRANLKKSKAFVEAINLSNSMTINARKQYLEFIQPFVGKLEKCDATVFDDIVDAMQKDETIANSQFAPIPACIQKLLKTMSDDHIIEIMMCMVDIL